MKHWYRTCICYALIIIATLCIAFGSGSAVSAFSQSRPIPRDAHIIIDPGHGGIDGGAVSVSGKNESSFNLEIALRVNDLFALLGYDTTMIRTTDISVYTNGTAISEKKISDLKERVRITNSIPNAILVSIHQNTFSDGRYKGTQIFYAHDAYSKALAEHMQHNISASLQKDNKRSAKKCSGVYLMEHIQCPGILIECGFISNLQEENLLRQEAYQKKLSAVIVCSLASFLSNT